MRLAYLAVSEQHTNVPLYNMMAVSVEMNGKCFCGLMVASSLVRAISPLSIDHHPAIICVTPSLLISWPLLSNNTMVTFAFLSAHNGSGPYPYMALSLTSLHASRGTCCWNTVSECNAF